MRRITASVRSREAASGSWTLISSTPLSSAGRNPPGSVLNRPPAPAAATAMTTSASTPRRTNSRTPPV